MYTPFSRSLSATPVIAVLLGCGSGLTLPDDGSTPGGPPPDDRTPAQLIVVGGNGQEARVGRRLDDPLVVALTDQTGRPVSGVIVQFSFKAAAPGAELEPSAAETDEHGRASAEVRVGFLPVVHQVEAHFAANDLRATFDVTAVQGNRGGGDGGDDD